MDVFYSVVLIIGPVVDPEVVARGYFGPDAIMPLGSALAALIGILLMFWRRAVWLVRGLWQRLRGT